MGGWLYASLERELDRKHPLLAPSGCIILPLWRPTGQACVIQPAPLSPQPACGFVHVRVRARRLTHTARCGHVRTGLGSGLQEENMFSTVTFPAQIFSLALAFD